MVLVDLSKVQYANVVLQSNSDIQHVFLVAHRQSFLSLRYEHMVVIYISELYILYICTVTLISHVLYITHVMYIQGQLLCMVCLFIF